LPGAYLRNTMVTSTSFGPSVALFMAERKEQEARCFGGG